MMENKSFRFFLTWLLLLVLMAARADNFTLKGKVIDEDGNAVELVTVSCVQQAKRI